MKTCIWIYLINGLRNFENTVKKLVMSIEHCLQGYRKVRLMKRHGIESDVDKRIGRGFKNTL
jgi:hypothetical protein